MFMLSIYVTTAGRDTVVTTDSEVTNADEDGGNKTSLLMQRSWNKTF
ncbi:hypothetical protein PC116_g29089 [Phytophthora cactorum]|uniref:Uncharacterized protein n=1 Tax=Phytophthora cactorum TaxID=29920 RepID=A0A8T1JFV2_9STRA|nr:hypothetical protein PC111_g24067 [Phytophthora cactorum]KAG2871202.1 hypothetical protein PC114_g27027 [Phytophthora cactorum]KAG2874351.1 hypothetical protein PC115_g24167 [Phytophthora cactorum]KAG2878188.1 hypothetical protein PC117_g26965 [Phytophthora cactorum]KAG2956850.1 hypothetical protein PC118_g24281 [Phytophthora cactorum]